MKLVAIIVVAIFAMTLASAEPLSEARNSGDNGTLQLAVAALTGGLMGAFLKTICDYVAFRWQRPWLTPVFDRCQEGCEVETNQLSDDPNANARRRYLRLRIKNDGRTPADNVTASVVRISFTASQLRADTLPFREEVLDLKLSLTGEYPIRIPAGAHRFLDVCFTHSDRDVPVAYGFEFRANPIRLQTFGFGIGFYTAELFISADGAPSRRIEIKWNWDGSWEGLRIHSFGYMF